MGASGTGTPAPGGGYPPAARGTGATRSTRTKRGTHGTLLTLSPAVGASSSFGSARLPISIPFADASYASSTATPREPSQPRARTTPSLALDELRMALDSCRAVVLHTWPRPLGLPSLSRARRTLAVAPNPRPTDSGRTDRAVAVTAASAPALRTLPAADRAAGPYRPGI